MSSTKVWHRGILSQKAK